MRASVIIPTKNGGPLFRRVLTSVLTQNFRDPFEIIAIDSGSTDGTAGLLRETAAKDPRLKPLFIAPETFQHGRTRNQAIAASTGEIIALLTQDALPANERWLARITAAVAQRDDIAGAFGRHLPHPESPLCIRREIAELFARFDREPPIAKLDPARIATDETYRQTIHFFSNNNSAIRRAVWEKTPFPEVEFGEDQHWIDCALRAGHARAYAPDALVYHAHHFTPAAMYRRARTEAATFRQHFGHVLVPRAWHIPLLIRDAIKADIAFAGAEVGNAPGALQSIPLNIARALGHYAGSRHR